MARNILTFAVSFLLSAVSVRTLPAQSYCWPGQSYGTASNLVQSTPQYSYKAMNYGYATTAYPAYTPTVSTYFYTPQESTLPLPAPTQQVLTQQSLLNRGPILIYSGNGDRSSRISSLESRIQLLQSQLDTQLKLEERINLHEERLLKQSEILDLIHQNIRELTLRTAPRDNAP